MRGRPRSSASASSPAFPFAASTALAVDVTNASEPVLCAEKDNVTLNFASPQVKHFRIEARIRSISAACATTASRRTGAPARTSRGATSEVPPPRKVTFYEDVEVWLTGFSFANFWRDKDVPIRVGDRVEHGLHLIQLWVRRFERAEEVLVLYPGDGYWRIRPLPPAHLGWSAYGSSFLVGPIEAGRARSSTSRRSPSTGDDDLHASTFDRGGTATLKIAALDRERLALDVAFDRAIAGRPFATLRSMYVTETNADVARVALREESAKGWREEPIMGFTAAGDGRLDRAHGALEPQHERAGHRLQPLPVRLICARYGTATMRRSAAIADLRPPGRPRSAAGRAMSTGCGASP